MGFFKRLIRSLKLSARGATGAPNFTPPASGGGAPSGAAGGDLAGTYPNPTLDLTKAHTWTATQQVNAGDGSWQGNFRDGNQPDAYQLNMNHWNCGSGVILSWQNNIFFYGGSTDTGIARNAVGGAVEFNNGTAGGASNGIVINGITTTARLALTPVEGQTVYDLTLHKMYTYDGTTWQAHW